MYQGNTRCCGVGQYHRYTILPQKQVPSTKRGHFGTYRKMQHDIANERDKSRTMGHLACSSWVQNGRTKYYSRPQQRMDQADRNNCV